MLRMEVPEMSLLAITKRNGFEDGQSGGGGTHGAAENVVRAAQEQEALADPGVIELHPVLIDLA